ncbi:RNA-directed DNA polymerase, eukaryota, partial [Tanacetum coccineum]
MEPRYSHVSNNYDVEDEKSHSTLRHEEFLFSLWHIFKDCDCDKWQKPIEDDTNYVEGEVSYVFTVTSRKIYVMALEVAFFPKRPLGSGCGTRIRFWKDIWVGETPLFTRYNRLYHLDQDKDCLIIDRINNGQWSWNWSRTNLGVRNLAYLCDMLNEIGQLNIDVNEDTCTWSLGPNGTFTVKDARYRIDQNILPTLAHTTTWDKSIPRKVNVFMWRLSLDRLPHRLNLSSRGMDIPAISCPSCNANVESANHVFFECDIATDMWKLVFRWCDIPLFQASSWDSFNDWIISWHASKEKKHRFYVITTSVLWWLWRYRNSVTFNSQPLRKSDLFDNVRFSSFSWLHNRDHMKLSWNDWLMYPLSITRNGNGRAVDSQEYQGLARHHHKARWEARNGEVFGNNYLTLKLT